MKLSVCGYLAIGLLAAAPAALADGQAVYDQNCAACHKMMAPKTGDKTAWAPLIKQGADTLTQSVIKGKGMMPARGGHANLSDADIKSAVEYMISKSK